MTPQLNITCIVDVQNVTSRLVNVVLAEGSFTSRNIDWKFRNLEQKFKNLYLNMTQITEIYLLNISVYLHISVLKSSRNFEIYSEACEISVYFIKGIFK